MKKCFIALSIACILAVFTLPAVAAEVDIPFVLRLTGTQGGTTASNVWWQASLVITDADTGQETTTQGITNVMQVGSHVVFNRWIMADSVYTLKVTRVYNLTQNHYIYLGDYIWESDEAWAFDHGMKITRVMDYTDGYPFRIDNDEEYFFFNLAEGGFQDPQGFDAIRFHEIRSGTSGQETTITRARTNGQARSGEYIGVYEYDPEVDYSTFAITEPTDGGVGFPPAVPAADQNRIMAAVNTTNWPTTTVDPVNSGTARTIVIPLSTQ